MGGLQGLQEGKAESKAALARELVKNYRETLAQRSHTAGEYARF